MSQTIGFEEVRPDHPEAVRLLDQAADVLLRMTGADGRESFGQWAGTDRHVFLLARMGAEAVGCGAIRPLDEHVGEIKRMFATRRGQGIGAAILRRLEEAGRERAYRELWCETRTVNAPAVRFYQRNGWLVQPNYGGYAGRAECICFRKVL